MVFSKTLVVGLLFSVSSWAFTLGSSSDGSYLGFEIKDKSLRFDVNYDGCDHANPEFDAAVDQAADAWSRTPASSLIVERGAIVEEKILKNPPIIYCDSAFGDNAGDPDPNFVGGVGSFTVAGGRVTTGAVRLNTNSTYAGDIFRLNPQQLAVLVTHEIGHVLGLGHSPDVNAIMYYTIGDKDVRLSEDDIAGVNYLYPRDELSEDGMFGCGTISGPSSGSGGSGLLAFSVFLLMLSLAYSLARVRRREWV